MGKGVASALSSLIALEEWQILVSRRPNLLLCGEKALAETTLLALVPVLGAPVVEWTPGGRLLLPAGSGHLLILRDVHFMGSDDQLRLLERLHGERAPQVISTAPTELFSRVQRGLFFADLYYCLNTLYVELG